MNRMEQRSHTGGWCYKDWNKVEFMRLSLIKLALELDFDMTYTSNYDKKIYKKKKFLWWEYDTKQLDYTWYEIDYKITGATKVIYEAELRIAEIEKNITKYMAAEKTLEGVLQKSEINKTM